MITEAKFKVTLRDMMEAKPLADINVTALCKKCGVHRQTFYYHYQDIYDLLQDIFLNEDMAAFDKEKTASGAVKQMVKYIVKNYAFISASYNSASSYLVDEFVSHRLNRFFVSLWLKNKKMGMPTNAIRDAARRFSHMISDEITFTFKTMKLSAEQFEEHIMRYSKLAVDELLPVVLEVAKKESLVG